MTRFFNALWGVVLSSLLVSCANLPVHQSKKVDKEEAAVIPIDEVGLYDNDSKLKYGVFHDSQNLYISLVFLDPMALMSLKRGGLNIYLDPKGKQKKEQVLCFPIKEEGKSYKTKDNSEEKVLRMAKGHKRKLDPERIISMLPEYAIWKSGGEERVFRWRIENDPCRIKLKINELRQLEYQARIPLDLIFCNIQDRNAIAVGLECKVEMIKQAPNFPQGRMGVNRGAGGGRMGGARRANAGMKGGGSRSVSSPSRSSAQPVDLWFKVELQK